ncbi:unnamed protein product [Arctia plantaginis]|uniref:Secreted protein n=1 Tax=Arctia plantaginis TaxID=874455 RepID=A0A8S1BQ94_ARCPL|nr:unnamed protein product [Arctia plantaginis]CAB3260566.1 unnamed protein product [Arctia plantaginis]
MSHARTTALLYAYALVANAAADAAPALAAPIRSDHRGSKMVQEETIVVRRLPNAYFYPFSLWPLPKFPVREHEATHEARNYRRSYNIKRQNER